MSSIVKRRKTTHYAQINNEPLQSLEDLRAIGLLAHLMSLPEDWEVRKMQLYKKFGKAPIQHAFKELEDKGYMLSIKYRVGKRNEYVYHISDIPFTYGEIEEILIEVVEEHTDIMALNGKELSGTDFQHLKKNKSSGVENQQLNNNNSSSPIEKRQLLKKEEQKKEKQINMDKEISFVNKAYSIFNEYYPTYAIGRWNKQQYQTIANKCIREIEDKDIKNLEKYIVGCLENMSYKHDMKNGKIKHKELPYLYNWLED